MGRGREKGEYFRLFRWLERERDEREEYVKFSVFRFIVRLALRLLG